ncbi:unnamed protein product [Gongylonema pulchrum]|uniref:TACC_C domain-containing protein n=1 Tax=Gongylonema pulchrum TaxID=637853 RepID=A0A183DS61_9BILA|nr:unnamed protein product [Gongylonema pulchrum]
MHGSRKPQRHHENDEQRPSATQPLSFEAKYSSVGDHAADTPAQLSSSARKNTVELNLTKVLPAVAQKVAADYLNNSSAIDFSNPAFTAGTEETKNEISEAFLDGGLSQTVTESSQLPDRVIPETSQPHQFSAAESSQFPNQNVAGSGSFVNQIATVSSHVPIGSGQLQVEVHVSEKPKKQEISEVEIVTDGVVGNQEGLRNIKAASELVVGKHDEIPKQLKVDEESSGSEQIARKSEVTSGGGEMKVEHGLARSDLPKRLKDDEESSGLATSISNRNSNASKASTLSSCVTSSSTSLQQKADYLNNSSAIDFSNPAFTAATEETKNGISEAFLDRGLSQTVTESSQLPDRVIPETSQPHQFSAAESSQFPNQNVAGSGSFVNQIATVSSHVPIGSGQLQVEVHVSEKPKKQEISEIEIVTDGIAGNRESLRNIKAASELVVGKNDEIPVQLKAGEESSGREQIARRSKVTSGGDEMKVGHGLARSDLPKRLRDDEESSGLATSISNKNSDASKAPTLSSCVTSSSTSLQQKGKLSPLIENFFSRRQQRFGSKYEIRAATAGLRRGSSSTDDQVSPEVNEAVWKLSPLIENFFSRRQHRFGSKYEIRAATAGLRRGSSSTDDQAPPRTLLSAVTAAFSGRRHSSLSPRHPILLSASRHSMCISFKCRVAGALTSMILPDTYTVFHLSYEALCTQPWIGRDVACLIIADTAHLDDKCWNRLQHYFNNVVSLKFYEIKTVK